MKLDQITPLSTRTKTNTLAHFYIYMYLYNQKIQQKSGR